MRLLPYDPDEVQDKMRALIALGHPCREQDIAAAPAALDGKTEMDAIVAYLQGLGTTIKTRHSNGAY